MWKEWTSESSGSLALSGIPREPDMAAITLAPPSRSAVPERSRKPDAW